MVTISIFLVVLKGSRLNTKFQVHSSIGFGEEVFERLLYMGVAAVLVM